MKKCSSLAGAAYFVFSAGVSCEYEQARYYDYDPLGDANVALHGLVNFGGGVVNAASGMVNGLTGVANWGNNTCVSLGVCVDIPDIPAIPTVPIWGDYDQYRWSSYSGSATLQLGVVVASAGIGSGGLTADAGTALLNASGINLLRAGAGKLTSLWRAGETGTEAVTAVTETANGARAASELGDAGVEVQLEVFGVHNAENATEMVIGPYLPVRPDVHYITVAEDSGAMDFDLGEAWTSVSGPVNNRLAIQAAIDAQLPVRSTVSVTDLWVLRAEQVAMGQEPTGNSLLTEWQMLQEAGYVWADPYTLIPAGSA